MKLIFGNSPITSILGYLIAGLVVVEQSLQAGETNWVSIGVAVLTALLGRKAADAEKVENL
jgi:VanZ family protein